MPAFEIVTLEYDVPLEKLLDRRLTEAGVSYALSPCADGMRIELHRASEREKLSLALSKLLCRDLQYFVLAKMADALPLTLAEKQEVLTDALYTARAREPFAVVSQRLSAYLKTSSVLCLEGFLLFRMQEPVMFWQLCVEEAATAVLLQKEYSELMRVLHDYVHSRGCRIREVQISIHGDGSCTLSDDSGVRIEYVDCSPDGLITLLIHMAPERLVVYDLSADGDSRLTESLRRVFSGRIKIYRAK